MLLHRAPTPVLVPSARHQAASLFNKGQCARRKVSAGATVTHTKLPIYDVDPRLQEHAGRNLRH
ncbi:hypothetical protein DUNSADRAFT_6534 [Dunaliella salina]|uniref:Encoded protein n=1 Tax=Dunaliella salina TaxID=3046 RepID=A0ABQ7FTT8_DUNSA|nr:hypothetical protein DUNSADRAFT_6534 [Dunaliella salina]|eukprot:KAF5825838.1 hypothetical protein DUNSADRAFT_6534 [Dunaliella salina]